MMSMILALVMKMMITMVIEGSEYGVDGNDDDGGDYVDYYGHGSRWRRRTRMEHV